MNPHVSVFKELQPRRIDFTFRGLLCTLRDVKLPKATPALFVMKGLLDTHGVANRNAWRAVRRDAAIPRSARTSIDPCTSKVRAAVTPLVPKRLPFPRVVCSYMAHIPLFPSKAGERGGYLARNVCTHLEYPICRPQISRCWVD